MKKFLIICLLFISCGQKEVKLNQPTVAYKNSYRSYIVDVINIQGCDYVFWDNGYGSDMEHFDACSNPLHSCK